MPLGAGVAMAGGLRTETMAQVCEASKAGTLAVICVAVTLDVVRVVCIPLAFQFMVEPPVGSEDGTGSSDESGTAALPGAADEGEIELRTGRGFGGGLMMNEMVLEAIGPAAGVWTQGIDGGEAGAGNQRCGNGSGEIKDVAVGVQDRRCCEGMVIPLGHGLRDKSATEQGKCKGT